MLNQPNWLGSLACQLPTTSGRHQPESRSELQDLVTRRKRKPAGQVPNAIYLPAADYIVERLCDIVTILPAVSVGNFP